jgi:uncharacterized protein
MSWRFGGLKMNLSGIFHLQKYPFALCLFLVQLCLILGCDSSPQTVRKPQVTVSQSTTPTPTAQELRGEKISEAARMMTVKKVRYEETYEKIDYPMGDVSPQIGVCTDMVIRSFRAVDIDLQQLLHEDRRDHPDAYPTHIWEYKKPDKNIDHRRCQNLVVFFQRHAEEIDATNTAQWNSGDVIFYYLNKREYSYHVGIITKGGEKPVVCHLYPPFAMEESKALKYGDSYKLFRWKE